MIFLSQERVSVLQPLIMHWLAQKLLCSCAWNIGTPGRIQRRPWAPCLDMASKYNTPLPGVSAKRNTLPRSPPGLQRAGKPCILQICSILPKQLLEHPLETGITSSPGGCSSLGCVMIFNLLLLVWDTVAAWGAATGCSTIPKRCFISSNSLSPYQLRWVIAWFCCHCWSKVQHWIIN